MQINFRIVLILIGILLVFGLIVWGINSKPEPPEPTPTSVPTRVIRILGAGPTFTDPLIHQLFLDKYNVDVQVASGSDLYNFKPDGKNVDFAGIAVIFGGQSTAGEELMAMYPDGLPSSSC